MLYDIVEIDRMDIKAKDTTGNFLDSILYPENLSLSKLIRLFILID
jgi:hypothetical protein